MVSSFYDANGERAELYAKQFFDDYKKLVPKEKFIESIAMSLEVCAEEGADTERMESAEEAVTKWTKKILKIARKPKPFGQWRKYAKV